MREGLRADSQIQFRHRKLRYTKCIIKLKIKADDDGVDNKTYKKTGKSKISISKKWNKFFT